MLAGNVVTAVGGGVFGLVVAVAGEHGVFASLMSYQLGGLISMLGYIVLAQAVERRAEKRPAT